MIRMLTVEDADAYVAHSAIHDLESGTEGDLPYGPYSRLAPRDPVEMRARLVKRLSTPVAEAGWRRVWGVCEEERIVGTVHLAGGDLSACLHRAQLGVGVERSHRRRGWGRKLVEVSVAWARAQPSVDWIDLGVFQGNDHAHALYLALGFAEHGRTRDLFRVDGLSIDDIQMSLWVGAP